MGNQPLRIIAADEVGHGWCNQEPAFHVRGRALEARNPKTAFGRRVEIRMTSRETARFVLFALEHLSPAALEDARRWISDHHWYAETTPGIRRLAALLAAR